MFYESLAPEKVVTLADVDDVQKLLCTDMATRTYPVSLTDMEFTPTGTVMFMTDGQPRELPFTQDFLDDTLAAAQMPSGYIYSLTFDLFQMNFRERRTARNQSMHLVAVDDRAVGLTSSPRPAKTVDIVEGLREKYVLREAIISDRGAIVDFLIPTAASIEPRLGDTIHEGLRLTNSESGGAGLKISRYTYRLICSNGMVVPEVLGHARWAYDIRMTYKSCVAKVIKDVDELVDTRKPLDGLYRRAIDSPLTEESLFNVWRRARRIGLNAGEADESLGLNAEGRRDLQAAVRGRALEGITPKPSELTMFEAHNRLTEFAHTRPLRPRTRSRLEELGGNVLLDPSIN